MKKEEKIEKFCEAIVQSEYTVTITGAGISVAAGGVTYAGMATRGGINLHSNDPNEMYRSMYKIFMGPAFEHGPTVAHKALARLEELGKMQGIITTNEDCIHTMAGSKNVAEIQGSFQINTCSRCDKRTYGYEIWNHGHMPTCPHCGGILLPYNIYSHIGILEEDAEKARDWISKAHLILVIGTSGYYGSVYWDWRRHDATIIQINPKHTHFDPIADFSIHEDADPVFEEAMPRIEEMLKEQGEN